MSKEACKHSWSYEHVVYNGDIIRRWCSKCGLIQRAKATNWKKSTIGKKSEFSEYPNRYGLN